MDNKQTPDNKIADAELLSDSELESVAGGNWGGQTNPSFLPDGFPGQTGHGFSPKFISPSQIGDTVYGGQLGHG